MHVLSIFCCPLSKLLSALNKHQELRLSDILTRSFDLQEGGRPAWSDQFLTYCVSEKVLAMIGTETIDPGLEEKELTELLSELYAKVRWPQFLNWILLSGPLCGR